LPLAVALVSAAALSLAFPKTNLAAFAPLGAAGLFWSWRRLSWPAALLTGWLAGIVFFGVMVSWFGETAAKLPGVGAMAWIITLGPAALEGSAWAAWAALAALAYRHAPPALAPLAAAAAFSLAEWGRSSGFMGAPFAHLGYPLIDTPLAALAAFAGSTGLGFVVACAAAYAVEAAAVPALRRTSAVAEITLVLAAAAAWLAWPARHAAAANVPVAAIQGNIKQDVKWTPQAYAEAMSRYSELTLRAAQGPGPRPRVIVWPETAVATVLNQDAAAAARLASLAREVQATIVAGALEYDGARTYNSLYFFAPDGTAPEVYRKRQLVPFAEYLPGERWLSWIPATGEVSRLSQGHDDRAFRAGPLLVAPLVCWEADFSDLMNAQIARGADTLLVATDDAWFGTTAGPYQHEQIVRMRAVESGRWSVRAAATGISSIIDPLGREVKKSPLEAQTVVEGSVGLPADTAFAHTGPFPVALAFAAIYAGITGAGIIRARRRASESL
jgi:apolipoprotein N-acyltransferase